jgi:hypothetical protein
LVWASLRRGGGAARRILPQFVFPFFFFFDWRFSERAMHL